MPKYDLNQAADFNLVTQGTFHNLIALFGGRDPADWDIVEAAYNGVPFHVFESKTYTPEAGGKLPLTWQGALGRITDMRGRRKIKYQYPYRDGQTTDDLGRKPIGFELQIVIHGPHYMDGVTALLAEADKPTPGVLTHPVFGDIPCVLEELEVVHAGDQRKAAAFRATFIEHNFTLGDIEALGDDSSLKSALATAMQIFQTVDAVINKVEGALLLVRGIKNLANTYLNIFKQSNAQTLTKINLTFNSKGGSADIPALLPVNLGGSGTSTTASGAPATAATDNATAALKQQTSKSPFATTGVGSPYNDGSMSKTTTVTGVSTTIASQDNFGVVRSISDPFNGVPVDQLTSSVAQAVAATQIAKDVGIINTQLGTIIRTLEDNGGALELFDEITAMRRTAVLLQTAFETGVASSRLRIVEYTTPRLMSIREVAFENGIDVNLVQDIDLLNPQLLSVNWVPQGTVLKVPVS